MSELCQGERCRPDDHGGPRRANGWPLCEVCEQRVSENLRDIADLWPDVTEALRSPEVHGEKVSKSRTIGLPLNETVADARRDALNTLAYWVHVIVEEASTLTAPSFDLEHLPDLAHFLAKHSRWLTRNYDQGVCISISADAHRLRRDLRRAAYPNGGRRYDPGIACVEHGTDDQGARVPCPGHYTAWVFDGMGFQPDLTCSADSAHVLTPAGFRRLKRTVIDPAAAKNLMAAIVS